MTGQNRITAPYIAVSFTCLMLGLWPKASSLMPLDLVCLVTALGVFHVAKIRRHEYLHLVALLDQRNVMDWISLTNRYASRFARTRGHRRVYARALADTNPSRLVAGDRDYIKRCTAQLVARGESKWRITDWMFPIL